MSKQLIVQNAEDGAGTQLYVLAPSTQAGILWVDMDDYTGSEPTGVTMDLDRAGATALRDFLTEWLDSLDTTG